jgi:hypothetical protein
MGKIIVERVIPDSEFLRLQIYFYKIDWRIEVSHRFDFEGEYMGMWYIYDESFYNENVEHYNTWEHYEEPTEIVPTLTKTSFVSGLSGIQKELLLSHFNSIYGCEKLNDKEFSLTYLAHLLGEKLVIQSGEMTIIDVDAEFSEDDYKIYVEDSDDPGVVNLNMIKELYKLDKVYEYILKL